MSVTYKTNGPIAIITIDRADRRNAVDWSTAQELFDAFTQFDQDDARSVAILTGEGEHFCAGADLKALADGEERTLKEDGPIAPMGPTRMRLTKPTIAAINGFAVAGGLELALWCDLRVASPSAVLGVFCRRFGVPLIDLGSIRLPRLIGHSRASDLLLTGRPVAAKEAFDIGLVNRLTENDEPALSGAIQLAETICAFPQRCLRNDRLSMLQQWDLKEKDASALEMRLGLETLASGETIQGATRFKGGEGRHGQFKDST